MKLSKQSIAAVILVSFLVLGLITTIGFKNKFFKTNTPTVYANNSTSSNISSNPEDEDASLGDNAISATSPAKDVNSSSDNNKTINQIPADSSDKVTNPVENNTSNSSNSVSTTSTTSTAASPSAAPNTAGTAPAAQVQKPAQPAPNPAPPSIPTSTKLILGYATYYYSGDSSSYNSLTSHSSLINELVTHTYITDASGNLYIQGPFPSSQVSYANSHGINALAIVRNEFSANVASSVLNNINYRNNLVNSILNSVRQNNFKGVNIDFEMLKASDRDAYTNFVREVYNTLHPLGYMVTIALPAKTFDSAKAYWTYPYDYVQLGLYADQVILMTYDYSYPGGTPGPIAPIDWVQQVVNYAASVIPRSKLLLGIAAYGYDWPANGGKTISYGIQTAYETASRYGEEVKWDSSAQVPYYNYTDSNGLAHSVYFENSTSIGYKLNVVNNSNLLGAAIWRLGLEDESFWTTIRTKLNK